MTNNTQERGRLVVGSHDEYGRYVKNATVDEYGRRVGNLTGTGGGGGGGGATSAWRSAELYGGSTSQCISFDPLGTRVIVGSDDNGVVVSTDGGVNWVPAIGGYKDSDSRKRIQTVGVLWSKNATTPNRVWNGNNANLMVSNNSGLDWVDVPNWPGVFNPGNGHPRVTGHVMDDDGAGHIYMIDNLGDVYRYTPNLSDGTNTGATTFKRIARLGDVGTCIYLDPVSPTTTLFATTRGDGTTDVVFQIENIQTATTDGATVRTFNGTGSPSHAEDLVAVNESGTVKLYVASMLNLRRVARATLGGSGGITTAWDTINPPVENNGIACVDAVRSGGSTLLVVGQNVGDTDPPLTSNGSAEIYYAPDGHAASPTWQLLTGDDAASDFVNAMGGPGGQLWWGMGIRAGAVEGELAQGRWMAGQGVVEDISFDPVHTNRILAVGETGVYFFDTASKKAYPAMVGLMTQRNVSVTYDPSDENHVVVTAAKDISFTTKTGGYGGDWRKNELNTIGGDQSMFKTRFLDGSVWGAVGDEFLNQDGQIYWNYDPTAGYPWVAMNLSSGGRRPLGLAARTIGGSYVVLAAVQDGGIYKSTWTPGVGVGALPSGGSWAVQSAPGGGGGHPNAFAQMGAGPGDGWLRSVPLYFVSNTVAYAFDPASGIWRSNDAGSTWSNIWQAPCVDNFGGVICSPDDETGTIYVAMSANAQAANVGVWKLTNADLAGATVENGQITKTKLTRPDGTNFADPVTICCQTGGKVFVADLTSDVAPRGYLSTNSGSSWTEITDSYFSRSVHRVTHSMMTPTGRIFIAGNGPMLDVYDTSTSIGGDGTSAPSGTITRRVLLQWAVTDPTGTSFTSDVTQATGGVNRLLVAHVFSSGDSVNHGLPPTSLTGLGLTWTQREDENVVASDLTERHVTTFTALTNAAGVTGQLVATFAAAQTGCAIHVTEYANIDTSGGGGRQTVTTNVPSAVTTDTTDQTSYTIGPFTPTANAVLALVIRGVKASAPPTISTVTDTGSRTWTAQASNTDTATDNYIIALYTALAGASPSSTTITVTFGASMTGCDLKVVEMLNCDTTTPIPSGQTSSGQTASTGTPSSSLPLAPAATSMVLTAEGVRANPAGITDESGWSLVADIGHGTPNNGLHIATRLGDQFWSGTLTAAKVSYLIAEFQGATAPLGDPVVQTNSANWGSTLSRPTVSLSSLLANPSNAVEYASVTDRSPAAWDPETGWTELWDSGFLNPSTGPHVAGSIAINDNSFASPLGTNDRWGATILEIGVGSGGAVTTDVSVVSFDYNVGIAHEATTAFDFVTSTVSLFELTHGGDDTNASSFLTAFSYTPTTGRTVYMSVESSATTTPPIPTVTGNNLTWTMVDTIVWDNGTTTDRRRLTVFKGVGASPTTGKATITFSGTQTGVMYHLVESNGSVLQTVKGSASATTTLQLGVTPVHQNGTTFLVCVTKKSLFGQTVSNAVRFPGGTAINFPNSNEDIFVFDASSAVTVTSTWADVQDSGMIILELAGTATNEVAADFDFVASGAAVVVTGKKHPRKQRLFRVYATFDGQEVPMQSDWQFAENAFGGYDSATLALPERFARAHPNLIDQDSPVTFWSEAGEVLWQGLVKQPPDFKDGRANLQCEGPQYKARGTSDRLMYQIVGTSGWATGDADPFTYKMDHLYDVSTDFGRLLAKITKVDPSESQNKDIFQNGDHAGWIMWAQQVDITRVAYVVRKSDDVGNFELNNYLVDGPNGNITGNQVASFQLGAGGTNDGDEKIIDQLAGNHDQFIIFVNCNQDNTKPGSNTNIWLQDIRVNGLANDDYMTTAQIARDIADRCGWDTVELSQQDTNGLPFDTDGTDWGAALDYLSQLDNTNWQAYGDEQDGVTFRRQDWNAQIYETSVESGAEVDLTPESIFDTVSVNWQGSTGKKHTTTLSRGNGKIYPPAELSDAQRDDDNAQAYAERLLDEFGSPRYSGTVTLTAGDRELHAGRNLNITDWDDGKSLNHQISDITQTEDGIKLGIRWPAIVSNYLARLQQRTKAKGGER